MADGACETVEFFVVVSIQVQDTLKSIIVIYSKIMVLCENMISNLFYLFLKMHSNEKKYDKLIQIVQHMLP